MVLRFMDSGRLINLFALSKTSSTNRTSLRPIEFKGLSLPKETEVLVKTIYAKQ